MLTYRKIIAYFLIIALPLFYFKPIGYNYVRSPQCWLFISGVVIISLLSIPNFWIKLFLFYSLFLWFWHNRLTEFPFSFDIISFPKLVNVGVETAQIQKNFYGFVIDHHFFNSTYLLICLFLIVAFICFIKYLDENYIKLCILLSSYLVFYFWIYKKFTLEKQWIAGAFLAFSIPFILSSTKYKWLNLCASIIPLIGCLITKSTMAIGSGCLGFLSYLYLKKQYKTLISAILLISVLIICFVPFKELTTDSFRPRYWKQTIKHVGFTWLGTGLRSYREYGFLEGYNPATKVRTLITHAHNEFLEIYCEMGLIGLLILLGCIYNLFKIKTPVEYKAGLIAIIFHCYGYYAAHLAMPGILILLLIGVLLKYKYAQNKTYIN